MSPLPPLGLFSFAGSAAGDFESIETFVVGAGGASSITFSSIPSTYKHLQIRYIARSASANGSMRMTFNSDSSNNYTYHELTGNGSSASAAAAAPLGWIYAGQYFNTANTFAAGVIDIVDYASTVKNKTVRLLDGHDENGSGTIFLQSGSWMNSSNAISSITITRESTYDLAQYSHFALYGIKG